MGFNFVSMKWGNAVYTLTLYFLNTVQIDNKLNMGNGVCLVNNILILHSNSLRLKPDMFTVNKQGQGLTILKKNLKLDGKVQTLILSSAEIVYQIHFHKISCRK